MQRRTTNWGIWLLIPLLVATLIPIASAAPLAQARVLYNATLGTLPSAQGMLYQTEPSPPAGASQRFEQGATTLDTISVRTDKAGYVASPLLMPSLDRTSGFTVRLTAQILAESRVSVHRAGLNLIVLSSDLRGVELGFWANEVWAQADGATIFTHAEGGTFDTTAALTEYTLTIKGDRYKLTVGSTTILSGPLRDYSSFGFPYNTRNFLFVGDNTSSAAATSRLSFVSVDPAAVPNMIEDPPWPTATPLPSVTPTATPAAGCFTVTRSYSNDWQSLRDAGIADARGYTFRRLTNNGASLARRDGNNWRFVTSLNGTPHSFAYNAQARLYRSQSGTFSVEVCPPGGGAPTNTPTATSSPTVTPTSTPTATPSQSGCFTVTRSRPNDWQSLRDAGIADARGYTFRRLTNNGVSIARRDGNNWRFITSLNSSTYSFAFNAEARLYRSQSGTFSVEVCPP